ncbi:MAG: hypothetical protein V1871_02465 [Planctomycetota bacterium]
MASKEDLSLGEIAVKTRLLTQEQLTKCLEDQKNRVKWKSLGEIFVEKQYITDSQLQALVSLQKRNLQAKTNQSRRVKQENLFGRLAIRLGFASEKQVEESLGTQLMINEAHFLRLGEIMVKKEYITDDQLKKIIDFQNQRQVTCLGCGQKYNLILFNEGAKILCYNCDNEVIASSLITNGSSNP